VYRDLGLDIEGANHAVDAGLYATWTRLSAGRLKVMRSCQHWLREYRMYRRDETGKIVKNDDHLMDATRYMVMSGLDRAVCNTPAEPERQVYTYEPGYAGTSWMA
jgi:hypothetical protein